MGTFRVDAAWDEEASVWVAVSKDIPGLVTEADIFEKLRSKLMDLVPELLVENDPAADRSSSLPVEIVATQRLLIDVT